MQKAKRVILNTYDQINKIYHEMLVLLRKPYYYKYAQENILCECPLCFCPSRDKKKYSFVYVCEKRKIMYFDTPKCASTTIRNAFFNKSNVQSLIDPKDKTENYFKFTFVRNPWDRIVSNWKMFTTHPFRIKQLKSMTNKNISKFEDFLRFSIKKKNHHWQPQVLFIPEKMDFIGKLENFNVDFSRLYSKLNNKSANNVTKNNSTERKPYWKYYNSSTAELVSKIYAEDIERFGYKFDENEAQY